MKKILALVLAIVNVVGTHVSAAGLSVEAENVSRTEKIFTVSGEAPEGKVVGYSVVKEGEDKSQADKLYAVGDTLADETGKFTFVFELEENAPSGKYIIYINALGEEMTTVDVEFVNYVSAENAIKASASASELDEVLRNPDYFQGLQFVGFSPEVYSEISSETERMKVATGVYASVNLSEDKMADILSAYNTYLGVAMINEKIQGGLEKSNPVFEDEKYDEITDAEKKSFLSKRMTENKEYDSLEGFNAEYTLQNVFYLFEKASVGEFVKYIDKYKTELSLEEADSYSDYKSLSTTKKENVANEYFKLTKTNKAENKSEFLEIFSKAVNSVKNSGSSGSGSSGGGGSSSGKYAGSGGGSFTVSAPTTGTTNDPAETEENVFVDIENYPWAHEAINSLADKGIVSGTGNGKFSPEQLVTREQLVKMVMLSIGASGEDKQDFFKDVDSNAWYAPYINEAAAKNIVYGISDNEFGVGRCVTRQDLAVIVVRAAKTKGYFDAEASYENTFSDDADISDYAKEAVNILFNNGIVNGKGDNMFMPVDYCTRAEAAKIIYGIFK